ncbi:hypothetical protein HI13_contig00027-0001, partial [Edwardsiella piscicida]
FGSSDWTRTSDIRINSPPFYRLNYRGIVTTGRIIAKGAAAVKGISRGERSFGEYSSAARRKGRFWREAQKRKARARRAFQVIWLL